MAWPTPALDDLIWTYDTGGKRWLHALCTAVNEREGCLGLTQTKFLKGAGGEAANLALSDLTGLWVGGPDDGAITNLNRCMVAVKDLVKLPNPLFPSFPAFDYEAWSVGSGSGGGTYSLAEIETAVGLGTFPDATDRFTDLNFWKQIQGALDLMIYGRRLIAASATGITQRTATGSSADNAWANAYAATPTTVSGSGTQGQIELIVYDTGGGLYRATFRENATITINSTALSGVLTDAFLHASLISDTSPTKIPASWDLGSYTESVLTGVHDIATTDLALGASSTLVFSANYTPSSTRPVGFGAGITPPYGGAGTISWADLYFDIAAELTDQA